MEDSDQVQPIRFHPLKGIILCLRFYSEQDTALGYVVQRQDAFDPIPGARQQTASFEWRLLHYMAAHLNPMNVLHV
jgi:hypothetical protein